MKLYFLTLFPEIISTYFSESIMLRAVRAGLIHIECINIRDFAFDSHKSVDDKPYGGGAGMVMRADVLERALVHCFEKEKLDPINYSRDDNRVLVTSASGKQFTQSHAHSLISKARVFIVCGHYEGIDQRFIDIYADDVIRVGDFVMTGGEIPALAVADSFVRLIPGVLGNSDSLAQESFANTETNSVILEYPHYTRPSVFHGLPVPEVLLSGNHASIARWRSEKSLEVSCQQERLNQKPLE